EIHRLFQQTPRALLGRIPGIFLVNKPAGITSHDAVALARQRLGIRRIGHGGTLDPFAEGLLILLVGNATRLFADLQGFAKEYRAVVRLGVCTDTYDLSGRIVGAAPAEAIAAVTPAAVTDALARFQGEILQTPPPYSALKKGGVPYYRLARKGEAVKPEPRRTIAYKIELLRLASADLELRLEVASGFYVRSLAHDLGQALGVGAALAALTRTRIGPFALTEAVRPEQIAPQS
ncbi:MAG: tRNA pseudouridine(55) synthase TruB, partial [Planctomycetota bacterium]|nr:tRNA pseudouridine(55) synthase TruB [Planctomycetota bacterium]